MALPPNAQPVPTPIDPAAKAEKTRKDAISRRRKFEDAKLSNSNKTARAKAIKKKGNQTYDYKEIQGDPDFGVGDAGPGTPYSIKSTKLKEKQARPPMKRSTPKGALPGWVKGTPLWPVGGNKSSAGDWKLDAIRRRLGNG